MLTRYLIAIAVILAAFAVWVGVQHLARLFAARHPEFGPAREEGEGCGTSCGCSLGRRLACALGGRQHRHELPEDSQEGRKPL